MPNKEKEKDMPVRSKRELLGGQSITLDKLENAVQMEERIVRSEGEGKTIFEADFRDQNLDTLPQVLFVVLKDLRRLHLDNNNLITLPPSISSFPSLIQLTLSNNSLSSLPPSITLLSSLVMLDARENKLVRLPDRMGEKGDGEGEQGGMRCLHHLLLGGNMIETLEGEEGGGCVFPVSVEYVDLQQNRLSSLPVGMGKYTKLHLFRLSKNVISSLPKDFGKLKNLKELDLSDNKLSALPDSFSELVHLRDLNLSNNNFNFNFPPPLFTLPSLLSLDFSHNPTHHLPPQISLLTTLKSLSLAHTHLSSLPHEIASLSLLCRLDLSENHLSSLPPLFGVSLPHLSYLSLYGNPLSMSQTVILSPAILSLKGLRTLVLEGPVSYHVRKWRNQYILTPATPRGERERGAGEVQEKGKVEEKKEEGGEGEEAEGEKRDGEAKGRQKRGIMGKLIPPKKDGKKRAESPSPFSSRTPSPCRPRSRTPSNPPTLSPSRQRASSSTKQEKILSPSRPSPTPLSTSPSFPSPSSPRSSSPSSPCSPSPSSPRSPSLSSPFLFSPSLSSPSSSSSSFSSPSPSSPPLSSHSPSPSSSLWLASPHSSSRPRSPSPKQDITLSPSWCIPPSSPSRTPPSPSSPSRRAKTPPCSRSSSPSPIPSLALLSSPPSSQSPSDKSNHLSLAFAIPSSPSNPPPSSSPPPLLRTNPSLNSEVDEVKNAGKISENIGDPGGFGVSFNTLGLLSANLGQFGDNFGTLTFDIPPDLSLPYLPGEEGGQGKAEGKEKRGDLFVDFAAVESLNKNGLRKGKKEMTKVGPNKKVYMMEDKHICLPVLGGDNNKALFCVFDGHSGPKAAEECVALLPGIFLHCCDDFSNPIDAGKALHQTFMETDAELPRDTCEYQGCTGTVCYLWENEDVHYLQVANVGDSFAFLVKNEQVIALTSEHSLSITSERERIQGMGIELYEGQTRVGGLKVTRALGDLFTKEIESGVIPDPFVSPSIPIDKKETSFLVVASDGLWDVISGQRAGELIMKNSHESTEKIANLLLKTAVGSSKCHDNVTAVVVRLNP